MIDMLLPTYLIFFLHTYSRTCECETDSVWINQYEGCKKSNSNLISNQDGTLTNIFNLNVTQIINNHLDKANPFERSCKSGFKRKLLSSHMRCRDKFELEQSNNSIKLHYFSKGKTYNEDQFCLRFKENNFMLAEVCQESESNEKPWYVL